MRLVKNYLYNVGYQILILLIPLITVPYVSRVLGPEGVGINSYTTSIASYFVLFGAIGTNMYGNRTIAYVRDDKEKMSKAFWEILILRFITSGVSIIIFLAFAFFIAKDYKIYYIGQLFLLLSNFIDISWFFMGIEDFKKTVTRNTIVKILSVILIFTFVKSENDILLYIFILNISSFIGNLTLWTYLKKIIISIPFNEIKILHHFKGSMHLFLPQIAIQIYLVLNKTMLGSLYSVQSTGYFDNADKIVKVVLSVVTASGTVMLPRVANTFAKGDIEKVKKYLVVSLDLMTAIAIPCMFGLAGIAKVFSPIFYGQEFSGIEILIITLSPVVVFIAWSNAIGNQYLLPTNQMKIYSASVIFGAVINFLLNLFLIPKFGAIGACISTVCAEFCVTFYQYCKIRKEITMKQNFINIIKYMVSGFIMLLVLNFLESKVSVAVSGLIIMVFAGISVYSIGIIALKPTSVKTIKEFIMNRNVL